MCVCVEGEGKVAIQIDFDGQSSYTLMGKIAIQTDFDGQSSYTDRL